ncbi:MAG: hypothetical protein GF392_04380, partial [Candidatus Omnitrophica bacterium]|nr:hypothetical protein [Candidatus Omnitrophota bacterium]
REKRTHPAREGSDTAGPTEKVPENTSGYGTDAGDASEKPSSRSQPGLSPELEELLGTAAAVNGWEDPSYRKGQVEAINGLKEGIPVELRTGGGKSLAFAGAALLRYREQDEPVLILTHEDALTEQAMEKDRMGEILSLSGVVTGFVLPDESGNARGVIYRDGQKHNVSPEEVYSDCAIIYAKWDRIVHRYMAEEKGDEEEILSANKYFALFDEADLMLVFGAATPAVISGSELEDRDVRLEIRRGIDSFVSDTLLADKRAYYIPDDTREVYLSRSGERMTERVLDEMSAVSEKNAQIISALGKTFVLDSLRAHLFYTEDVQYYVSRDERDKPTGVIVRDEHTGAPRGTVSTDEITGKTRRKGMSFGEGLQQAIEIKAGVDEDDITPETYTAMSMTVEQFLKEGDIVTDFAGASGTMEKERFESMYDKRVREIRGVTEKLVSRGHSGSNTREEKRQALLERLRERIGNDQPLLIKAESDAETEELREFIEAALADEISGNGIMISVADGRAPADFSTKMARAGYANMITIVTNLAHRGIDIEIKGARLEPDGTEGKKVPLENGKIPGLHVISLYLDEAEAFEIQTRGRADRGKDEIQGSWEGLFSLDEKMFAEHKDLLSHQKSGLAKAIANDDKEGVERLISETRELIVSQRSRTDERRRRYEEEVFGYQRRLLKLLDITADEESFAEFLESIDAYDAVSDGTSSPEELAEKVRELRMNIRVEISRALERFQTEQQRTRSRISYLSDLSQLGIRGVFTRLNVELIAAVRLARNFHLKVRDIKGFAKNLIADSMGDAVSGVRSRR